MQNISTPVRIKLIAFNPITNVDIALRVNEEHSKILQHHNVSYLTNDNSWIENKNAFCFCCIDESSNTLLCGCRVEFINECE